MPNYSNITLIGHLGQDPKTRSFEDGNNVTSFSLATNMKLKDGSEIVSWWNCSCWGNGGSVIAQYCRKGDPIMVSGAAIQRPYTDQSGQQRISVDVRVRDFTLLGGKRDGGPGFPPPETTHARPSAAQQTTPFNDDIPF
jgi:single-strand DNA-binding protein